MRTLIDNKDRKWDLQITVGTIELIRDKMEIDLYDLGDKGFIYILIDDPIKFVQLLWTIFEDEADKNGIDRKSFIHGWDGDEIDKAVGVFLEGLISFFPAKKRGPTRKAYQKVLTLAEKSYEMVGAKVGEVDMDQLIDSVTKNLNERLKN